MMTRLSTSVSHCKQIAGTDVVLKSTSVSVVSVHCFGQQK